MLRHLNLVFILFFFSLSSSANDGFSFYNEKEAFLPVEEAFQFELLPDENKSIIKLLKESTDGPLIAIVVEDFAATMGLFIALIGTLLANFTSNPMYDAASSILIGILLMVSGLFLGYEMKHLITGESISQNSEDKIRQIIANNDKVVEVASLIIVSIGPNRYLALISIDYLQFQKIQHLHQTMKMLY